MRRLILATYLVLHILFGLGLAYYIDVKTDYSGLLVFSVFMAVSAFLRWAPRIL